MILIDKNYIFVKKVEKYDYININMIYCIIDQHHWIYQSKKRLLDWYPILQQNSNLQKCAYVPLLEKLISQTKVSPYHSSIRENNICFSRAQMGLRKGTILKLQRLPNTRSWNQFKPVWMARTSHSVKLILWHHGMHNLCQRSTSES